MTTRITKTFSRLKAEGRAGLVTYVMGGDPNYDLCLEILRGLPAAGADFIELGFPFTDPMADGPPIQAAAGRALAAGQTLTTILDLVRAFREGDADTPIILMGYYNPIYAYGNDSFLADAKTAGVDGLIVVDLPPEEDEELCLPARRAGIDFIRLATPTTDENRLPAVVKSTSGFVYYVSVAGVTGAGVGERQSVGEDVARIANASGLPVAVGFGVKTPEIAAEMAKLADAVVVGSAIVEKIAAHAKENSEPGSECVNAVLTFVGELSRAVKGPRK